MDANYQIRNNIFEGYQLTQDTALIQGTVTEHMSKYGSDSVGFTMVIEM